MVDIPEPYKLNNQSELFIFIEQKKLLINYNQKARRELRKQNGIWKTRDQYGTSYVFKRMDDATYSVYEIPPDKPNLKRAARNISKFFWG